MKKISFFTIIVLGFIIFISSCKTKETITEQQQIPVDTPKVWKQIYFPTISVNDGVLFYNSSEIKLEGEFFKQNFFVKDGVVNVIDSINNVSKIVPQFTSGGLVDMKVYSREIKIMIVLFSENDATYKFSFFRNNDGIFILNPKAELIFKNKTYPVNAITGEECVLLFYYNKQVIKDETIENAEGFK